MSSTGSGASLVPGFHSLEVLHRGASSTVYRAVPDAGGDPVAVKVLRGPDGGSESERLRRLSGVPGVVRVLGHGSTTSGRPFVAMELHGGGDYGRVLADRHPLPVDEVVRVGLDVAGALAGVHALGLLHHAVEPSNVLAGEGGAVLADAGATLPGGSLPPPAGQRADALLHAPPEAVRGEPPTAASDVYRLAATLWELLAGRPPFGDGAEAAADPFGYRERVLGGGAPGPPRPGLPAPLVAALARALDRDPGNRYADAEGFAAALAPDDGGASGTAAAAAPAHGGVPDAPGTVPPPVADPPPVTPGPGTAPPADDDTADPWQGLVEWEPPRAAPAPPPPPPAPAFGAGTPYAVPAAQAPFGPATGGPAADRGPVPPPGDRDAGGPRPRRLRLVQAAVSATAVVVIALGLVAFVYPGPVAALLASVGLMEPGADPSPAPVDPSSAPHAAVSRESAPTGVEVEDSGGTVVLTWTDNAGEGTPHHVVGGPAGGAYTALAEAGPGAAEARVTGLDAAGEYCFVVIAVLSADEVAPSEEACTERGAG
ncbi:protein kinase domain-containing protein [Nocardiopsis tropica]|uniref:non-specific serine/threonine protein kinase n=1 Tax=Nocardiopsis tropica TaxID=109330 RepID=A0ABU7L030_9ACTN|nr:protein kinase [Nocardiopsis umidischolae]MEE2054923.1 protein kinase [Nocardiopsis umidischolae]